MAALVVVTRGKLAEAVARVSTPDNSWALCWCSAVPTAAELAAVKEAARVCDRVAVVRLAPDVPVVARVDEGLGEAGADVVWVPHEVQGRVRVVVDGEGVSEAAATLMVQALCTVLPNVVMVPRAPATVVRTLRALELSLGDMLSMKII